MKFLEKDLEQIIFDATPEQLRSRGLDISNGTKFLRQYPVQGYGVIDLLGYHIVTNPHKSIHYPQFDVLELKQGVINTDALLQVSRYMTAIKRSISSFVRNPYSTILGCLIGRDIDLTSDFIYLAGITNGSVCIYTYDYYFDGIQFTKINPSNYYNTSENLPPVSDSLEHIIMEEIDSHVYENTAVIEYDEDEGDDSF